MNGDEDSLGQALTAQLVLLGEDGRAFSVIEFAGRDIVVWTVRRDGNGTPQARQSQPLSVPPWTDWTEPHLFYEQKLSPLIEAGSPLLIVSSEGDDHADLIRVVRGAHGDAPVYNGSGTSPLEMQLREAISDCPLTRWYELVVLRRTASGRLGLDTLQLFPPRAKRGYSHQFRIRCEPSNEHGTVFAVVTPESRRHRPVSVQSAAIRPGVYELTAVLMRPGHIRFEGLPALLRQDTRPWREIVSAIPARLHRPAPAHLVCLIEIAGTSEEIRRRIDRVEQLIASADIGDRELAISLISYGAHAFDRRQREESPIELVWAASTKQALPELRGLGNRKTPTDEYPRAAQLECALAKVAGRLNGRDGRPVLVTVGGRPPFPARSDLRTEILPCPRRQDWNTPLRRIYTVPGITFGALHDGDTWNDIWARLGRDAFESVGVADMDNFGVNLDLREPVEAVPLPLIDTEGRS